MKAYQGLLLLFLSIFMSVLLLTSGCRNEGRLLLSSPDLADKSIAAGKDRSFSLHYRHSVEKTPVIEYFRIGEQGQLILIATTYRSYGVGLPFLPEEGRLTLEGGWMKLDNLHRVFQDIRVRVGPEAEISLQVDEKSYPIHQWYPPGSLVIIRKEL